MVFVVVVCRVLAFKLSILNERHSFALKIEARGVSPPNLVIVWVELSRSWVFVLFFEGCDIVSHSSSWRFIDIALVSFVNQVACYFIVGCWNKLFGFHLIINISRALPRVNPRDQWLV